MLSKARWMSLTGTTIAPKAARMGIIVGFPKPGRDGKSCRIFVSGRLILPFGGLGF
jgi:hypothetical protein